MLTLSGQFVLASASPRRKELFSKISNQFEIIPSAIDEFIPQNIGIKKAAEYLAKRKASDIFAKNSDKIVIGCDTVVISGGKILGKPKNKIDAQNMLSQLSGKTHLVVTGVCIKSGDKTLSFSKTTKVTFFPLSGRDIEDYIATGEPFDKAGAYGIQGQGSLMVKKISGDYFNVMGLPISEVYRKLKSLSEIR